LPALILAHTSPVGAVGGADAGAGAGAGTSIWKPYHNARSCLPASTLTHTFPVGAVDGGDAGAGAGTPDTEAARKDGPRVIWVRGHAMVCVCGCIRTVCNVGRSGP